MAEEKDIKAQDSNPPVKDNDIESIIEAEDTGEPEALGAGESEASSDTLKANRLLREMMEYNFIEYASYVIKDRAIPDVDDGLKPVHRRILWSLFRMDDGKFHKVANAIGHTMQYHPHGDASIGSALVVLANKEYFIEKQGNFGNILTGDNASAARYIECRLSPLGKEVLFNNDITKFEDSYDGRNKEPVVLPVKIPSLLMLGAEGIAVGMATKILPHNFCELLNAQIACLRKEPFELFPDFLQGGLMDASEYDDGRGKITLRARIERDGRRLVIHEIPATTTTESLIASIEKAVDNNKIKVAQINDFTGEDVEIEILPVRGQDPDKTLKALYAYTDCSVSINLNMMVICDNQPVQMTVTEILERNTEKLLEYLKLELEIELGKLEDQFHNKTLAQIFIENRIYKRIEECETFELVMTEVYKGLEPFLDMLKREVTDDDIQRLLAIPIRRISLFDINKNQQDINDILAQIDEVNKNLKQLKKYAIKYLTALLDKYGKLFPRRTEIDSFDKIDLSAVALNNIKIGWDRKNCYVGTSVRSDDQVTCNEVDHLLCVERSGMYKVINIPDKVYIGRLMDFRKYDKTTEFGVVYKDTKSGKFYGKRCVIGKFITDREYQLCPDNCKLEIFTPRTDAIYLCKVEHRMKDKQEMELNLKELPMRSAKARGFLISSKPITKITHVRYLEADELAAINGEEPPDNDDDVEDNENEIQDIDLPSEDDESSDNNENDPEDVEVEDTAPAKKAEEKPEKPEKQETKANAKTSKTKTPEKVEPEKQEAEKPESGKPAKEPVSEPEAKPKKTLESEKATEETEVKPERKSKPQKTTEEPVSETEGNTEPIPETPKKTEEKPASEDPEKTDAETKEKNKDDDDDNDDDLGQFGIKQLDFGF